MDKIFTEHYVWAVRVAMRVAGTHHDAEDVVSEVFASLHRAIQRGAGPTDNVRAYLRRAIQNEATRVWVQKQRERIVADVPEQVAPDPAEAILRALQRKQQLAEAPPLWTDVLYQSDVLGERLDDIAAQFHITTGAVKGILKRVRERLRMAA